MSLPRMELHLGPRLRRLDTLVARAKEAAALLDSLCLGEASASARHWSKAAQRFVLAVVAAEKAARLYADLLREMTPEQSKAVDHLMAMDAAGDAASAASEALDQAMFAVTLAMATH